MRFWNCSHALKKQAARKPPCLYLLTYFFELTGWEVDKLIS